MRIMDLAEAIKSNFEYQEIGVRPGEKIHEEMISPDDSRRTLELANRYVVLPIFAEWGFIPPAGAKVVEGFSYRSDTNTDWLTAEKLKKMIASH